MTTFVYDPKRRPSTVTQEPGASDPTATLTTHIDEYDNFGNVESAHSEGSGLTRSVAIGYDDLGIYPQTFTNALGQVTQVRYDERFGLLETVVDPNGLADRFSYDGFGRLAAQKGPTTDVSINYAPTVFEIVNSVLVEGAITSTAQVTGGPALTTTYNPAGEVVAESQTGFHGQEFRREFRYDWAGRLITEARTHATGDSNHGLIARDYDLRGRLLHEVFPNGNTVEYHYSNRLVDGASRPDLFGVPEVTDAIQVVDSNGVTRTEAHDYAGNVMTSIDGSGAEAATVIYKYGPAGALHTRTDQEGGATAIVRDAFGRVQSQSDPDTGTHNYTYNAFGEVLSHTDALGRTEQFSYDPLGRIHVHTTQDGDYTYNYDGPGPNEIGRLVSATAPTINGQSIRTDIEYDDLEGLPSSIAQVGGGHTLSALYTWDSLGRLAGVTYPAVNTQIFNVSYFYDPAGGELERIDQSGALSAPTTLWQLTASDGGFLPQKWHFGNGADTTLTYHPTLELVEGVTTTLNNFTAQNLGYLYRANGSVLSRTNGSVPDITPVSETFGYDSLNRLTSRARSSADSVGNLNDTFGYAASGNILSSPSGTYVYDSSTGGGPHSVSKIGDTVYIYDAVRNMIQRAGPLVKGGEQSFTYDGRNQLTQIIAGSVGTGQATPTSQTLAYSYDAFGGKVQRVTSGGLDPTPTSTVTFLSDLYEEVQRPGVTNVHHFRIHGDGGQVAELEWTENVDGSIASEELSYFHTDALGSVTAVSDDRGLSKAFSYAPFGNVETQTVSQEPTDQGFTGHRPEADLGLIDMQGRFYDPIIGRFLSPDPIIQFPFHSQSHNPYSYAMNDPLNWVDPSGFEITNFPNPFGGTGTVNPECLQDPKNCKGGAIPGTNITVTPGGPLVTQTGTPPNSVPAPDGGPIDPSNQPPLQGPPVTAPGPDTGTGPSGGYGSANPVPNGPLPSGGTGLGPAPGLGGGKFLGENGAGGAAPHKGGGARGASGTGGPTNPGYPNTSSLDEEAFGTVAQAIPLPPLFGESKVAKWVANTKFGQKIGQFTRWATGAVGKWLGGKGGLTAAKGIGTAQVSQRIMNAANHIFGPSALGRHGLEGVLKAFGGDAIAATNALEAAAQELANQGAIQGVFQTTVNLAGESVTVRGAVINGTAQVSTAFIPP